MKSIYKALVIGTGFGGAVAACRLAQASLHVGVLERGKDYRTTRFPHNDGDTGAVVFAGGGAGDAMTSTSRFITPIVAKGRVFVAANGQLYAFAPR